MLWVARLLSMKNKSLSFQMAQRSYHVLVCSDQLDQEILAWLALSIMDWLEEMICLVSICFPFILCAAKYNYY